MSRKALMTIGLSILVGTGLGTTLTGFRMTPEHRAVTLQQVNWGDAGREKGEVEAPRWGDTGSENGEVEAPRGPDQTTDGQDVQAPRDAPRA